MENVTGSDPDNSERRIPSEQLEPVLANCIGWPGCAYCRTGEKHPEPSPGSDPAEEMKNLCDFCGAELEVPTSNWCGMCQSCSDNSERTVVEVESWRAEELEERDKLQAALKRGKGGNSGS